MLQLEETGLPKPALSEFYQYSFYLIVAQDPPLAPGLAWHLLAVSGWPQILGSSPASTFWVLEVQMWATTRCLYVYLIELIKKLP